MVEQLICNQWVGGSNPLIGSGCGGVGVCVGSPHEMVRVFAGRFPSGQREQTVNLSPSGFGGSNPPLPTTLAARGAGAKSARRAGSAEPSDGRSTTGRPGPVNTVCRMRSSSIFPCGNSSAVERQPSKLGVAGSNPVSRSRSGMVLFVKRAGEALVAQSAEHVLGKDGVTGSIPVKGSAGEVGVQNV